MARLTSNQDNVAREAFLKEIRVKRAFYDVKQSQIAETLDIGSPRMSALLSKPEDISAGRLREIIRMLHLDPEVVLSFLGYTQKEIKKMQNQDTAFRNVF